MLGKYRFKVGQRVKPSPEGIAAYLFAGKGKRKVSKGTVTKVDQFNSPTVLWDGRKMPIGYHPDFVEPVRK